MINVTKTYLPNRDKYIAYVNKIFDSGWVTNNGELVKDLERRLSKFLGVKNIVLVANGTIALEVAYLLLKLKGEVVTTPFSFVATTSSLVSNGLKPIFSDINPQTLCLECNNIENVITNKTSAILPVHVFGNACEVEKIECIASKHNLKVIYDAAHAFGVEYKGKSLLNYGDVSILSLHATKLFHTIEGGALIINDDALAQEARFIINFGIDGADSVRSLGINGKMNEFEAAMGLCVLDEIENIISQRKDVYKRYMEALRGKVRFQKTNIYSTSNYSYFPIILETEEIALQVKAALAVEKVYVRRYFSPSLDELPYLINIKAMPNSRDISSRILALPMYPDLNEKSQKNIIKIILQVLS